MLNKTKNNKMQLKISSYTYPDNYRIDNERIIKIFLSKIIERQKIKFSKDNNSEENLENLIKLDKKLAIIAKGLNPNIVDTLGPILGIQQNYIKRWIKFYKLNKIIRVTIEEINILLGYKYN